MNVVIDAKCLGNSTFDVVEMIHHIAATAQNRLATQSSAEQDYTCIVIIRKQLN